MNPLSKFTTDELMEEIVRRRNDHKEAQPKKWCHDCRNFKPWDGPIKIDAPDNYNPCGKGHKMTFSCPPSDYTGDGTGFHRRVCEDRAEMTSEEIAHSKAKMEERFAQIEREIMYDRT